MRKRVLLGMSSGIDSSVSAILLKDKGFEVVGVTFIFSDLKEENDTMIHSAQKLAKSLNIEYHVVDLRKQFNTIVISYFQQEYINGTTPFPCAVCNPEVKFKNLIQVANKYNCHFISTGHYVQIIENKGFVYIAKGIDEEKDQSFFLWGLDKSVLNRLIFPLGNYTKNQVREIAKENSYSSLATKNESLGICFIEDNNYRNYLKNKGIESVPGNFINKNGDILGKHKGYINYTIGQRRGLGINLNQPMFVSEIIPKKNEVVLAEYRELYRKIIFINQHHFVHKEEIDNTKTYIVKIRYRLQENNCNIKFLDDGRVKILLHEPVAMVAKGQTAVIYDENRVIGGGFIVDSI